MYPKDPSLGHYSLSVYTSPLSTIAQSHQVLQQQYTDDTQLCVALSPLNYSNEINTLQSCLSAIQCLVVRKWRALNPTKSDAILFGISQRLKTMSSLSSVKLDDSVIQFFRHRQDSWSYIRL